MLLFNNLAQRKEHDWTSLIVIGTRSDLQAHKRRRKRKLTTDKFVLKLLNFNSLHLNVGYKRPSLVENYVLQTCDGDCCFVSPLALWRTFVMFLVCSWNPQFGTGYNSKFCANLCPDAHSWCSVRLTQVLGLGCKYLLKNIERLPFKTRFLAFCSPHVREYRWFLWNFTKVSFRENKTVYCIKTRNQVKMDPEYERRLLRQQNGRSPLNNSVSSNCSQYLR